MDQKMKDIALQFQIKGNITDIHPLGNGLINTTYAVVTEGNGCDYVMQNVNVAIFPDMDLLMRSRGYARHRAQGAHFHPCPRW